MPDLPPTRRELDAILRADLYSFLRAAFRVLEPGTCFVGAPYLEVLCHTLTRVAAGEVNRLVINMPPRHLKSLVTSVIWVAWILARNPATKIAIVCHNDSLAGDLARKCKRLIESNWYKNFAPTVEIRIDRLRDFETTAGGGVFSASIGSGITGRGFDVIILDDPQAANDVRSEVERERVKELFDSAISSRLDDQARGSIIAVQQRLHEDDLSGYLLTRGGWISICMPLVATEPQVFATGNGTWSREVGDILCEERFPRHTIDNVRAQTGTQNFETQYQQAPGSIVGDVIKNEYLGPVPAAPPSATRTFVSVDTAMKVSENADFTVFLVIKTDGRHHYVCDVIRGRFDVLEMRAISLRLMAAHRLEKFLIEDSASGPNLCTMLKENGAASELVNVGIKDKRERVQTGMHLFVDKRVFIVGDAPWTIVFRRELVGFPTAKHDDQVDAFTLYLLYLSKQTVVHPVILSAQRGSGPSMLVWPNHSLHRGEHPMRPRSGKPSPIRRF